MVAFFRIGKQLVSTQMSRLIDLTGQVFGNLTAISRVPNNGKITKWICICRLCSKETVVAQGKLGRGQTKCGNCSKAFRNYEGMRFGALIVGKRCEGTPVKWNCTCSLCGSRSVVESARVGKSPKYCRHCVNFQGVGDLSKTQWGSIIRHARDRKILVECTIEEAWELFKRQNGRCAISGIKLIIRGFGRGETASFDRIDSKQSYKIGNIQWVHKKVNLMKWATADRDFIDVCNQIKTYAMTPTKAEPIVGVVESYSQSPPEATVLPEVVEFIGKHSKNVAGHTYNKWFVLGKSPKGNEWVCRCECGMIRVLDRSRLIHGRPRSCGCLKRRAYMGITGRMWSNYRKNAIGRNILFDITIIQAWDQYVRQGGLCRFTGLRIGFKRGESLASMDRIRSDGSYSPNNIQWVKSGINMMKGSMEDQMFIRWCIVISKHQKSKAANQ